MSADRLAAYDGGPGVSRGGRSAIVSPRCDPHLRFDRRAMASETRPLPAVWRAPIRPQRRPIVQRRPTEGRGTVIPWPVIRGPISHCASPVALPLKPSPAILRRLGRATTGYVDHPQAAMGSRHRPGTASGTGRRSTPPPSRPCR